MNSKKKDPVNEPNLEYDNYSYADYLTWQMEEVVESKVIKGFALDLEEFFGDIE
ncbi:MAG: hypothetical protein R6V72_08070 [Cyclobacterium sp.]|nr:hypothetical protein [Cyclobacterium sp. SYSU L10401]